jgi:hypothetical protein
MTKLEQIFATNPKLLDEPEVKELIDYVQTQFTSLIQFNKRNQDTLFKIQDIVFHSDAFLIKGKDCKESIIKILEIL